MAAGAATITAATTEAVEGITAAGSVQEVISPGTHLESRIPSTELLRDWSGAYGC